MLPGRPGNRDVQSEALRETWHKTARFLKAQKLSRPVSSSAFIRVILELKAIEAIHPIFLSQLIAYLATSQKQSGKPSNPEPFNPEPFNPEPA